MIEAELPDGTIMEFPDETSKDVIQVKVKEYLKSSKTIPFDQALDTKTGAPAGLRSLVGQGKLEDQIANLKKYYPDVQPIFKSVTHPYGDNFVFTNPETGRPTLFNPVGIDIGDVAQSQRAIAETIGGIGGAAAGFAAPVPGGTYIGTGLGAEGAGQLYDLAQQFVMGKIDSRNFVERMRDATVGVGINTIMPKAFDASVDIAKSGLSNIVKPIKNKLAGAGSQQLLADYTAEGIKAPAGAISGNRTVQKIEEHLSGNPASARIMQEASQTTLDQTSGAMNQLAKDYGPILSKEGLGEIFKKGSKQAIEVYRKTAKKLEDKATSIIGENTPVDIMNTTQTLESLIDELKSVPEWGSKINKGIISIYEKFKADVDVTGKIPYRALRAIRTEIGESLYNPVIKPIQDVSGGKLMKLYGALTQDLEEGAKAQGAEAYKAFKIATTYEKEMLQNEIPLLEEIVKKGYDEQAYNAAMSLAQDGGSRLRILRKNIDPNEWDSVAGTILGRLGLATPGKQGVSGEVFSVSTFLTNWNKLSREAKDALFSNGRYNALRPQLDRLVRIIGSQKDVESIANTSRTGTMIQMVNTIATPIIVTGATGDVFAGAKAAVGLTLTPYGMAKLITNPKFVKWLAQGAQIKTVTPGNWKSHMARLAFIAEKEPEIKDEINQYMGMLERSRFGEKVYKIGKKGETIK